MGTVRGVSAILAQRNLPAEHERTIKGLNDEQVLKRRVELFWRFQFFKISFIERVFLKNTKNGHFDYKKVKKS